MSYDLYTDRLKAIADPKRLKIIDILSCGEICGCQILEHFDFTQPTLSHHMKVLMKCGLVQSRKDGTWINYSLVQPAAAETLGFLAKIFNEEEDCICKTGTVECVDIETAK